MRAERIKFKGLEYMRRVEPQTHITESYVCSPPALTITDETGAIWVLGVNGCGIHGGEFAFDVLRNGLPVGEVANRIERRNGKVYIFGPEGRKAWNGRSFI
jgi:hypothetical protein